MKKLLGIVVLSLLLSNTAYAANLSYVCEYEKTGRKHIFEIKNKKFYEDGKPRRTNYIKSNNINVELEYIIMATVIRHKVNLKNGKGFEIWKRKKDGAYITTPRHLKCNKI